MSLGFREEIVKAVEAIDYPKAEALVKEALQKGVDSTEVLQGVVDGMKAIGHKFETKEYYMLELMEGGDVGKRLIAIITPHLPRREGVKPSKIVIGTVKGDIHDIGKNLVITQLEVSGFEVYDLGVDVPSMTFIDKAKEVGADIIGMGAFITTTIANFKEVMGFLNDMGLRDKYKVIIGGGPTTQELAESLGADGWAPDAVSAVTLCERLITKEGGK